MYLYGGRMTAIYVRFNRFHFPTPIYVFWNIRQFGQFFNASLLAFCITVFTYMQNHMSAASGHFSYPELTVYCTFAKFSLFLQLYLYVSATRTLFTLPGNHVKISTIFLNFIQKFISFSAFFPEMSLFLFPILRRTPFIDRPVPSGRLALRRERE
jgi:hypothetical protein